MAGGGSASFAQPQVQRGNPYTAGGPGRTYFQQRPDVAAAYNQNSQGMSPTQFAQQHFQQFGQFEGNVSDPSQQFYQPVYQPQYQNYANPYTAFNVSTYGTQPMTSAASSWAAGQGLGQQHVTNSANSWLQQNPGADMNTMLNAMRGVGMNAYDVQGAGGFGNYGPSFGMPQMQTPFNPYTNSFQSPFAFAQQPQTNYGPAQQIVSRSASMRGTPNVMMRRAEGGIASLVGDE